MNAWTDAEKAQWILENGEPEYIWIYERNGYIVYKRPMTTSVNLPPWIDAERQVVGQLNENTGHFE